jgi:hypothetical protein
VIKNSPLLDSSHYYYDGPSEPMDGGPLEFLKCALELWKRLCQMKASLSKSSISFSVQSLVGRACKNIRTSWKFIFTS